ncbi:MAG: tetratricopeptide repeat protein, partial [Planctomycetaceae bacterium]
RQVLAYRRKSWSLFGVDHYYAATLGDSLVRLKLEPEAAALWTASARPGVNTTDVRDCVSRLIAKLEDTQQKIRFVQPFFTADTDYHGRFAAWIADLQLRTGDLDGFGKTLRESRRRTLDRVFRASDLDVWALHYMLHNYRTSHADYRVDPEMENTPENSLRVAEVIRDMELDWPSAQARLMLLEAEPVAQRKPMARQLEWQRVTRTLYPDSQRWDQLMPFAQQAVTRQDYSIAATLLTGMLENLTTITDSRRQQGRAMIGQCYTRLGTVGLTIDETSPIAPLLQAALYLRLGDERLTLETYLENTALFDQHRDEVPVDLVIFVCENLIAASGQENHEKVEDILRNWIIKNSESKSVDEKTKAQIQFLLARNFFGARRFDVARSEYQTVINRYPETSFATEAEFGIGETFMAQKVYDQAEAVFEKLAGSRDAEIIVRAEFLRGVLSHRRGDNDDARDIFRAVLERVPSIELANQALFNLAEVYGDEERYMDQLQLLMTVGRLGRVSKRQHAPGTALSIVVQDSDLGISRGHNRIPVIVRTEPGGDEEQIFLTSGGAGKGLFRADVDTELGPVSKGDNVLQVTGHDTIRCDYPEQFKSEFKSVPLSDVEIRIAADANFEVASSRIIDIEEESFSERLEREEREQELADSRQSAQRPTNQIKPGNPVYLRVKDGDRDLSDATDTIVAKLVADSGDQVQVVLTETEPHSGIFEGSARSGELPAGALATDTAIDHSPLMAIDKDPGTYWLSEPDGVTPKVLTVDMKDLHTVSRARFSIPEGNENRPVRAALQASYDGEFWYTVESYPQVPESTPLVENYGAMQFRLYAGSVTNLTTWMQVANLVSKGEPLTQGEVTDGQLHWQRPEDDTDVPKQCSVVWFGK